MKIEYSKEFKEIIDHAVVFSKKYGFKESETRIFVYLLVTGKHMTQQEIQEELGYSVGMVSNALSSLIEKGVIFFERGDNKKRKYYTNISFFKLFSVIIKNIIENDIKKAIDMLENIENKNNNIKNIIKEYKALGYYSEIIRYIFSMDKEKIKKLGDCLEVVK